jgi:hypothetical protein
LQHFAELLALNTTWLLDEREQTKNDEARNGSNKEEAQANKL